jgi:methylenetetrahydrofolate reductase (NADPH)
MKTRRRDTIPSRADIDANALERKTYLPKITRGQVSLGSLYQQKPFVLSFELFPPKTDKGMGSLERNLKELLALKPDFVTCTYGAGGGTRDKTLATLELVTNLSDVPVASHLTCVDSNVEELRDFLRLAGEAGIAYIVALRGDPSNSEERFTASAGGLSHANELVSLIRGEFPQFGIAVGGYPETHPEAQDPAQDLDNLKRKVDAGADVVLTQLFYVNDYYLRFRDRCAGAGIDVPIVPGIMPVSNFKQVQRITSLCGVALPSAFTAKLERAAKDPDAADAQFDIGVEFATEQVAGLVASGAPGVHFYVLNQCQATGRVIEALDLA